MRRLVLSLLTRDVERNAKFYSLLCGISEVQRSDAYILLAGPAGTSMEIALIDWVSELVPRAARGEPQGSYLSLVIDDVEIALTLVREFGLEIVEETRGEQGVLQAVVRDLDGRVIELSTPEVHLILPPKQTVA